MDRHRKCHLSIFSFQRGTQKVSGRYEYDKRPGSCCGRNDILYYRSIGVPIFSPKGERHTIRKGENYSSVLIAPDGKVWVATLEGNVYSYHPQTKVISREENACNTNGDAIKGMEIDDLGHLWILADPYVKEYNPTNHSFRIMYNSDRFIQMDYFLSIRKMENGAICSEGLVLFA